MFRIISIVTILAAASLHAALAELRLPSVFSDHMVLQRDAPIRIWGWADAGQEVTVTFSGDTVTTKTGKDGRWNLELPRKVKTHQPQNLTVNAGSQEIVIADVLIGEVWIASGQSNMAWSAKRGVQPADAKIIRSGPVEGMRLLQVPQIAKSNPQDDQPAKWTLCTPDKANEFSAVGYFFARQLREKLDVPIGIINSSWGGTPIQPWIPLEGWNTVPTVKDKLQIPADGNVKQRDHTALYNGMISPLAPLSVRGFIWYQGEGNRREHAIYRDYMEALITGWRTMFKNENAPFYFVQLAPYIYDKDDPTNLPSLQNAQRLAAETIPHTGMAVTTDIGDLKNIHPRNKSEVGRRLSLLALANAYNDYGIEKPMVSEGPLPLRAHRNTNGRVSLFYKNVGDGLSSKNGEDPKHFEIAGEDGIFHPSDAHPSSSYETVSVIDVINLHSPKVPSPTKVRYLWRQDWITNIANSAGLPASPFLIDVDPWE